LIYPSNRGLRAEVLPRLRGSSARRRVWVLAVAALVAAALAWTSGLGTAQAELEGPCQATINEIDLQAVQAAELDGAIRIDPDQDIDVAVHSTGGMNEILLSVEVPLPGSEWMVIRKTKVLAGLQSTLTETIHAKRAPDDTGLDFDPYQNLGSGIYRMTLEARGPEVSCSGNALLLLPGGLFDTKRGIISVVAVIVGGLVLLARILYPLFALLRVGGRLVTGGRPTEGAPVRRFWRPRIAASAGYGLLGLLGGVVVAGGLVMLLQQTAVMAYGAGFALIIVILCAAVPVASEIVALLTRTLYAGRTAEATVEETTEATVEPTAEE
jgi:hypothetical protein